LIPSYRCSLLSQIENIFHKFKQFLKKLYSPETPDCDETLSNIIKKATKKGREKVKRKHPSKGEKKKLGTRTKVQASIQHKRGGPQGGKGTTKY
jgi:hypothetical protein